ncbi:MAG: hypothetical protein ACAH81_11375 [Actinomycetota bacterium]
MLATVRVFVGAFLGPFADDEPIEDLQLVVGEVCSVMRQGGVEIAIEIEGERAHVACQGVVPPGDDEAGTMRLQVIEALAPDVAWADGAVRFSVPLARDAQIQ